MLVMCIEWFLLLLKGLLEALPSNQHSYQDCPYFDFCIFTQEDNNAGVFCIPSVISQVESGRVEYMTLPIPRGGSEVFCERPLAQEHQSKQL